MRTNFKMCLLAGTALVVTGMMGGTAHAVPENVGGGTTTIAGPVSDGINFTADGTAVVENGTNLTGAPGTITAGTPGWGTVRFDGTTQVNGNVGQGGAIGTLTINGDNNHAVTFGGTALAIALTYGTNGIAVFNDTAMITNQIDMSGDGFLRISGATFTATGGITGGPGAGTVTLDSTGILSGGAVNIKTLEKSANAGSSTVTSVLTAENLELRGGSLALNGVGTSVNNLYLFGNNSAMSGQALTLSLLRANTAGASTVNNVLTVTTSEIGNDATLNIAGVGNNLGALEFTAGGGTLLGGNPITISTITGNAGAGNTGIVSARLAGAATTVAVNTGTVDIAHADSQIASATLANGATLIFGGSEIVGNVTGAGGSLNLDRAGNQSVASVGSFGQALNTVTLSGTGTKTVTGNLHATNIAVSATGIVEGTTNGTITINGTNSFTSLGTITGNTTLAAAGTLNVGNAGGGGTGVVGTIDSANDGVGTVNFVGTGQHEVSGSVGAGHALGQVTIGAGTIEFLGSEFRATALDFTGNGTADLAAANANTGAQNIGFGAHAGTVRLGNNVQYTGNATANGGNGTLSFGENANVTGNIGADGHKVSSLSFGAGNNTVATTIWADTTHVGSGKLTTASTAIQSNVNFAGDGILSVANGSKIWGNVTAGTAGHGTIDYTGPLEITGSLGRIKKLTVTDTLTIGGDATAADGMEIGTQSVNIAGKFTTTPQSVLSYVINGPTTTGKITAQGLVTVDANTAVSMGVNSDVFVKHGQEFVLIDGSQAAGGGVATLAAGKLSVNDTALVGFMQKADSNSLVVIADRKQIETVAKLPNNDSVGKMLDKLQDGGNADIDAFQMRLAGYATGSEVEEALESVTPDVSGGAIGAAVNVGGTTSTVVNNRLASVRAGDATGIATGNQGLGAHLWAQVFGATANQDVRDGIAGYEADSAGVVVGGDVAVTDSMRAGIAFSYADTDVNGDDVNRTDTRMDSYQISLYGDVDLGSDVYASAQLGYMYSDIATTRHNVGLVAGNTATADFSTDQYVARGELGRDLGIASNVTITPSLLANYMLVDMDDFSETGAGGLGLRNVRSDDLQILEFGVNLKAEAEFNDGEGGFIKPSLHGGYRYDVIGDRVATIGMLAGGGAAFRTQGADPAQGTVNLGTGVRWQTASNWELTADYDYQNRTDYTAHAGYLRAGWRF